MANKTCIRRKQLDFKLILKGLVGANTLDSASLIEKERSIGICWVLMRKQEGGRPKRTFLTGTGIQVVINCMSESWTLFSFEVKGICI